MTGRIALIWALWAVVMVLVLFGRVHDADSRFNNLSRQVSELKR